LSIFGEYSGDSSRILLGGAEDRKLFNLGVGYGDLPLRYQIPPRRIPL
jgi:hypothetical protein